MAVMLGVLSPEPRHHVFDLSHALKSDCRAKYRPSSRWIGTLGREASRCVVSPGNLNASFDGDQARGADGDIRLCYPTTGCVLR
jgi:hypothetical protein